MRSAPSWPGAASTERTGGYYAAAAPPEVPAGAPITRILDCAVYLRAARGGLMLGGFEAAPLPVGPRAQPPGFDTGNVPLHRGVLETMAGQVVGLVPAAQAAVLHGTVAEQRGGLFAMTRRPLAGPVLRPPPAP